MKVLIAGGAGYIGSVCVARLLEEGHTVTVVDNLSRGHFRAVSSEADLYVGDIGDEEFLTKVFQRVQPDAVMHFCAHSLVGESVADPLTYYQNNVCATLVLLRVMIRHGVKRLVFSSTAAVYGEPTSVPITEDVPTNPVNPYGRSKLMVENILADCARAYGLRAVILRYFNAAGAWGRFGEDHRPETHLIPVVLDAALGVREYVTVFGQDYPTPDGTCVRDYIHVVDLADAHLLGLKHLDQIQGLDCFNLGNGTGFSVREIIQAAEEVTGRAIPVKMGPRRPGDPAVLVASSDQIRRVLGWSPRYTDIREIIRTIWEWKRAHPFGYSD